MKILVQFVLTEFKCCSAKFLHGESCDSVAWYLAVVASVLSFLYWVVDIDSKSGWVFRRSDRDMVGLYSRVLLSQRSGHGC